MDKYIKQLLQLDSKVILPKFGAIVIANEETGSLMFNEYLTYDDGKIVGLVVSEEKIDQEKAKSKVQNLIQEIQAKLEKGDSYSLGSLGVFSKEDDKVSFSGSIKAGGTTPPPAKKVAEEKGASPKENIYIEKKDKDDKKSNSADKTKQNQAKADKEQLKKEKIEKKKAEKEKKIKEKEERKRKKVEDKTKRKAEKERLKKEKADKKKEALDKKKSATPPVVKAKDEPKGKSNDDKTTKSSAPTPAAVTPTPSKEEPKKPIPGPDKKAIAKKEREDQKKAENERKIKEEAERKKKIQEEKEKIRAEKERLKIERRTKGAAPIKPGDTTKPPKNKEGESKEKPKKKPVFWMLIVLLIILLIGGVWVGLNYEKVESYMGWNKFEETDLSKVDKTPKDNKEPIAVTDSLEVTDEGDSLAESNTDVDITEAEESKVSSQPKVDKKVPKTSQPAASTSGSYHIIVGGFQEQSNAENMVQTVKGKGFDGKILPGVYQGLHFVAAQSYSTLSEAKADLQRIRQGVNDGAWIFKN